MAEETVKEEKAAKQKPKQKPKQKKTGLTYAQTLEARAQRGSMTHQKLFAVKQAKKKEMEGQ